MRRRLGAAMMAALVGVLAFGGVPSGASQPQKRGGPTEAVTTVDAMTLTTPSLPGTSEGTVTPAATVGLKAVSHNICGGQCNKGATDKLSEITDLIDAYRPHLIMLQEVCWPQFEWFGAHAFASGTYQFGYTSMMTTYTGCGATNCAVNEDDDPTNDDRRCWIGQVVGARGTLSNRDEIALGGERYQINDTKFVNPPRKFTALCYDARLAELGTRVVKGCSVHMRAFHDPRNINVRARITQATSLASDLDGDIAVGKIVVVGGDFNSRPTDTALDAFYRPQTLPGGGWGVFYEADQDDHNYYIKGCASTVTACRSGAKTVGAATKYDYIFFSETVDPASVSGLPIEVAVSDHDFYRGLINVSTT